MNEKKIEKELMDKLQESAKACAQRFINVPKNILTSRAEEESEVYASILGIEDGDYRDAVKEQFKEIFIREVIDNI